MATGETHILNKRDFCIDKIDRSGSMVSYSANISASITLNYSFPSGEAASGKPIIAVIDADNTVAEANETNNHVVFGPIP